MKYIPVIIVVVAVFFNTACEKRESTDAPITPNNPMEPSEPQLMDTKRQLASERSEQSGRIAALEVEIQNMKSYIDEKRAQLELLEAEKKQMLEDLMKLKKRWEKETEGLVGCDSSPIHEIFRGMRQKMEQVLQENEELKRQLEAAGK